MILSRYVKTRALLAIMGAVLGLWLLKMVFEYLAEIDKLSATYTYLDALRYILYNAPKSLEDYMPIGALLGAVVGLGLLANNSELVVIRASGVSNFRIVGWVMQPALIFVLLGLVISQFVIPVTNPLASQVKNSKKDPLLSSSVRGYWDKKDNQIMAVDYADAKGELKNITLWQMGQTGEIQNVRTASSGRYLPDQQQWQLSDITQLTIDTQGNTQGNAKQSKIPTQNLALPIAPESIYLLTRRPEDMSVTELWQHKQFLTQNNRRSLEHEVAFWKKVLSPFSVLSLVLVACSFVFGSLRTHSLGLRIVVALLFGLVFSYIQDLVGFVSLSTGISPLLMVLLPILASAGLGWYLIQKKR